MIFCDDRKSTCDLVRASPLLQICYYVSIKYFISVPENNESTSLKNAEERERAFIESRGQLLERLERQTEFPATESEKRIGAYKEMLEPQVRDAIIKLVEKGYVTIDSGYDPRRVSEGVRYIGFEKGMINTSMLPAILEKISSNSVALEIESDDMSDYLLLTPSDFKSLEEWKTVWDGVADAFPDRDGPAPIRERFIDKSGIKTMYLKTGCLFDI